MKWNNVKLPRKKYLCTYVMQLVNVLSKNNASIHTFNHILHDICSQEKTIFYEKKVKNIENKKRTKFTSKLHVYNFFLT